MCSVSLMPVFNHLCKVSCWMLNTVYLIVYLSFQVLCLLLNSLLLILKMNLKDYVQNLTESEWKVSETCVLASLNRAKEIWRVMQGNGCTSILGFFKVKSWKVLVFHAGHLIVLYCIDTDEMPGFFLLLKSHIFTARSKNAIFIFLVWGYWCRHGY